MRILLLVLCCLMLAGCIIYPGDDVKITSLGYNIDDVRVFLSSIGNDSQDFIASPSLRRQYEKFRDGENTAFFNQAKNNHDKSNSQSSGLATGIAVGMVMNSGR